MSFEREHEDNPSALTIAGGFAVIGTFSSAFITAVGEVMDQAGIIDDFPGSTGAKIMGGFFLSAAALLTLDNIK